MKTSDATFSSAGLVLAGDFVIDRLWRALFWAGADHQRPGGAVVGRWQRQGQRRALRRQGFRGLSYVPGPTGQAFKFNGGGAQVDFGNSAGNFGTRDFTIAYWMKTDSNYPPGGFLAKRAACNAGSLLLEIRVGSRVTTPMACRFALASLGLEIDWSRTRHPM